MMRFLLLLSPILLASMSIQAELTKSPEEIAALHVVEQWREALVAHDLEKVVSQFATELIFLGTGSKKIVTSLDGVRAYFKAGFENPLLKGAQIFHSDHVSQIYSKRSIAIAVLDRIMASKMDDSHIQANGRITFVVNKIGKDWKIVSFHRASLPD